VGSVGDPVGAGEGAGVGEDRSVFTGAATGDGEGAATGDGEGAGSEPLSVSMRFRVLKSILGELLPGPTTASEIPSDIIAAFTWDGVMEGSRSRYKAATPATCCR